MRTAASSCSEGLVGFEALFKARSVAFVGLSADPQKLNGAPLLNLRRNGFTGRIYPVNPKYAEIGGLTCYPSITALPEAPDVVVVMVQAAQVPGVIAECGRRGVGAAVVLTSGFEEAEGGHALAQEMARVAEEAGITLIGPNCEGVWSVAEKLVLTFGSAAARDTLHHAPIAIVSQSGAVAGALARHLQDAGYGCSYVVSVGNETCTDALDVLDWLIEQPDTKVALLFIEGLKDGARLLDLAQRARERGVKLVALKSGNSAIGREAAGSHTGKLASAYAIYRDVFRQAGVVQVESLAELIEAAEILTFIPPPKRSGEGQAGVSVFSIPGGTRALTADLCERYGVPLARFSNASVTALTGILPAFGQAQNPTDLTGQVLSHPDLFEKALAIVAEDAATEALIIQLANRGPRDIRQRRELVADIARRTGLPIVVSLLGDVLPAAERREMIADGIVAARDPADAVRYLSWLYAARQSRTERRNARTPTLDAEPPADTGWAEASRYLAELDLPIPQSLVVAPGTSANALACDGPYVVKALPEQAEHKTELGLVEIGLKSVGDADAAVARIRQRLGDPQAPVLIQAMAKGVEAVLSIVDDPDFGPVLAIGTGGQGIELWGDIAYLALPATESEIRVAIARLKLSSLLNGFRGAPAADGDALVAAALTLGDAALAARGRISEIELNPVFVGPHGQGLVVADVLIRHAREGADRHG
ncbi:acetate--CoA ligase family protein [Bosea sp. BK604]|uniref:acetate--CoA ligase family protein n=1 Tax=Bosea sp. BK604 TaxID=2512180 RepID=UPI00104EACC6|nr:acetate--CoA ligase family protein [Bosea sp. BK604]TCR62549.1 acyl-CoA synthetase (NDP forming) [Bosea sp. BK604]